VTDPGTGSFETLHSNVGVDIALSVDKYYLEVFRLELRRVGVVVEGGEAGENALPAAVVLAELPTGLAVSMCCGHLP
jgi:hypothetical protein